jgi:hypothetical protein
MTTLRTEAWLLRGISSVLGELRLKANTLSFKASETGSAWPWQLRKLAVLLNSPGLAECVEEGKPVVLFEWPVSEVDVATPWYYFGGGITLRHQGVALRLSFGRPATNSHTLGDAAVELNEVTAMRARGKLWVQAIGKARAIKR